VALKRFQNLFEGLARVRGVYEIDQDLSSNKKKVSGKAYTKKEPHSDQDWINHLEGKKGLGIVPIRDDQCCVFCALDVDEYNLDLVKFNAECMKLKLPFVLCRTKSGGAHLYMFFSEPIKADVVKDRLKEMARAVGYPSVEIFPKQKELREGDVGNWINLPYFDVKGPTVRYAFDSKGKAIPDLEAFCDYAESKRITKKQLLALKIPKVEKPFDDGPPCLQRLATNEKGFPTGSRNSALFNVGVYARLKFGEGWKSEVENMNHDLMKPPLMSDEVTTILKSLNKAKYYYTCEQEPICNVCARDACLGRKYGVGRGNEADGGELEAMLGRLQKTAILDFDGNEIDEPPEWYMDVDGVTITLATAELMDQSRLIKKLAERLRKYPLRVRPQRWQSILKEKIEGAEIVKIPPETGTHGKVVSALKDFCLIHGTAESRMDIETGHVWTNDEGQMFFKHGAFWKFLVKNQIYRARDDGKHLHRIMRNFGATKKQLMLDSKQNINRECWCIKKFPEAETDKKAPAKRPQEEF
jgi:hypothetical protein